MTDVLSSSTPDLVTLLERRAREFPDKVLYRFLGADGAVTATLTYGELHRRARGVAATLATRTEPGDRVLLLHPSGPEFLSGFFGSAYARVIAVPAPYPRIAGATPVKAGRLESVLKNAEPAATLSTAEFCTGVAGVAEPHAFGHLVETRAAERAEPGPVPAPAPGDRVMLQYTSGSTSDPKGVILTHGNFVANLEMVAHYFPSRSPGTERHELRSVTWLPLFHDMGLATVLQPLYFGSSCTVMEPFAFLLNPSLWLKAVSDTRAHISTAPNFAYQLCVDKADPERGGDRLDLRSVDTLLNGAEPVRPDTIERFNRKFAPYGLSPNAMAPCYGLAEATVFVSGTPYGSPAVTRRWSRTALLEGRVAEPADDTDVRTVVGCGEPGIGVDLRIVDPQTLHECPPGTVGEIWIAGPNIGGGYWQHAQEAEATFGGVIAGSSGPRYLRTGDAGLLHDGQVFLTGRFKDTIIVDGRNHDPHDIELSVENCYPGIARNRSVAFAEDDESSESVVIALELDRSLRPDRNVDRRQLTRAVRRAVAEEHQIAVSAVVLLKPGGIPRTTSGKLQRHLCRALFRSGSLNTW